MVNLFHSCDIYYTRSQDYHIYYTRIFVDGIIIKLSYKLYLYTGQMNLGKEIRGLPLAYVL